MKIRCAACGAVGNSDNPPMEFICSKCGCVNVTEIKEESGAQTCGCLLPTTFEWTLPCGKVGNPITGYKYISPSGTLMTKTEWIMAWGVDPDIALKWMRDGEASKLRNDDIDIGGGWRRRGKIDSIKLGRV